MAYTNTTRATSGPLSDRFASIVKSVKTALHKRRVYDQTVQELGALSDRDLGDLGIHRSTIRQIAAQAAYGV